MVGIASKLLYLFPASVPLQDWIVEERAGVQTIRFWNATLGAQPTQAALDAITDAQVTNAAATRVAQAEKTAANAVFDNGALQVATSMQRAVVALAQLLLDELNAHTTRETDLFAAIAAATSLANLQTRAATVASIPQRTQAQLIAAIKAKISATAE